MALSIVTWNVNSVRQRLSHLLYYIDTYSPDIICLQEIKCQDEFFPKLEIEEKGYNVAVFGQKTFNGVAILSKYPFEDVIKAPIKANTDDEQARSLEVAISYNQKTIRVLSLYCPNGNPVNTEKFPYKLSWNENLYSHAQKLLAQEEAFVLLGDYNIIPEPIDAARPEKWVGDALFKPESRSFYRRLINLGLTDALRACTQSEGQYTFWDYVSGAWQKNDGIRIDHALLSPQAADLLSNIHIDKELRAHEKPSDHVPVRVIFR